MPVRARRQTTRPARQAVSKFNRFGAGVAGLRRRGRFTPMMTPTYTETYTPDVNIIAGNAGGTFKVRISDIPQIADYQRLYRQYKINWVKIMLVPEMAGTSVDPQAIFQNNAAGTAVAGKSRIVYVNNTTPALADPINEQDVLTDNGCKIRSMGSLWSATFKPVCDKYTGDAAGGAGVAVRERFRGFLSFADLPGNNPLHYGISYWLSHYTPFGAVQNWKVYYKVNFSLRDPQ